MKSYLSFIPLSAKVHKRQSRMTRICIILAVFLVTAIFSMLEMWMDGQTTAMRHNHGNWHIVLQNVPEDKAEQICGNANVEVSSWYDAINVDADQGYYINGTIAGIVLGLILHYLIYVKIVIIHFGGGWNIPFSTIGIVFLLVAFFVHDCGSWTGETYEEHGNHGYDQ